MDMLPTTSPPPNIDDPDRPCSLTADPDRTRFGTPPFALPQFIRSIDPGNTDCRGELELISLF
jgi:hypothetical protein